MAEVAHIEMKAASLGELSPGDCFVSVYDYKRSGSEASVWMKVETRRYNPNDEAKPRIGFMTVNLRTGSNGGHTLTTPVVKVQVTIIPVVEFRP